jgi:hypothetical protein
LQKELNVFDRSYLPEADLEFAVIADTHYMIDPGDRPLEFESRRHQTGRSHAAMRLLKQLNPKFTIHLGDLVQEYPETGDFPQALTEALAHIDQIGLDLHHCAGNHDVGDKPDPAMPTHPVTAEGLNAYHKQVGHSWYSFDRGDHHIVVINTQILNTDLAAASEQKAWLESDMQAASEKRILLFLHLPPYLYNPTDPAFGNYDVIDDPARSWLLGLVEQHCVELMCAAHVHFAFFDRLHETDYFILPSPAFTRPGFSHLFTSAPPPEHGRDDTPKLGFYLFRSSPGALDRHVIRTSGQTEPLPGSRVITRTARSLPEARLGLTLTHTPTPIGEVPLAYPSIVRQTVRNDYPLLTCEEMGARHLRVPVCDILDCDQNPRLQILRSRGARLTAICATRDLKEVEARVGPIGSRIDGLELQVAKSDFNRFDRPTSIDLHTTLTVVDPAERVTGKQHLRTRIGCSAKLVSLLKHPFDRTLVSIAAWEDPLEELPDLIAHPPDKSIDISLDLVDDDDLNTVRMASAAILTACLPDARLFTQPYQDLDRTMDVANGFLDSLCNPRPVATVYRILNTVLFSRSESWSLSSTAPLAIRSDHRELTLLVAAEAAGRHLDLISGTSHDSGADLDTPLSLREILL